VRLEPTIVENIQALPPRAYPKLEDLKCSPLWEALALFTSFRLCQKFFVSKDRAYPSGELLGAPSMSLPLRELPKMLSTLSTLHSCLVH
jgi:hypothetical protein